MADEGSWRTPTFRQSVVQKIDEAIRTSGMSTSRNSLEMESHVFQKAKTKEEYLGFVARLILHVREMSGGPSEKRKKDLMNKIISLIGPAIHGLENPFDSDNNLVEPGLSKSHLVESVRGKSNTITKKSMNPRPTPYASQQVWTRRKWPKTDSLIALHKSKTEVLLLAKQHAIEERMEAAALHTIKIKIEKEMLLQEQLKTKILMAELNKIV